jgi:hypothetical protein
MDFPILLLVLLALPLVLAGVIIAVSAGRRRRATAGQPAHAGVVHRLQADPAVVQDSADTPQPEPRAAVPGRERRAASAEPPAADQAPRG